MKKIVFLPAALCAALMLVSFMPKDENISYEGKTAVVTTEKIGSKIRGYKSKTPVKVYIQKGKIKKVEALKNKETPEFFADAKAVLDKFIGADVKKVEKMNVDAVSGATFTSNALIENVKAGVKYYNEHK